MVSSNVWRALYVSDVRILNVPVRQFLAPFPELESAEVVHTSRTRVPLATVFATFARLDHFADIVFVVVGIVVFVQTEAEGIVFLLCIVVLCLLL